MTVRQLIAELQKFDLDSVVITNGDDWLEVVAGVKLADALEKREAGVPVLAMAARIWT